MKNFGLRLLLLMVLFCGAGVLLSSCLGGRSGVRHRAPKTYSKACKCYSQLMPVEEEVEEIAIAMEAE